MHLGGGFAFPPHSPPPRIWGKPKVSKICPFPRLIRHSCWSLALSFSGLVGNKGRFGVSLGLVGNKGLIQTSMSLSAA